MALSEISSSCALTDGDCVFEGIAQIMVRKDIGWEPMGTGGMSNILVRQHADSLASYAYTIEATSLSHCDEKSLLLCQIDASTTFYRISPTFIGWTTQNTQRLGLTFDTFDAAEHFSVVFDRILKAYEEESDLCEVEEEEFSSGGGVEEEWLVKGWGSCQNLSRLHIPDTMRCFQSPIEASVFETHDYFLDQLPSHNVVPNSSDTRHCRSASASSAPCLLRLNTNSSNSCLMESVIEMMYYRPQHQPLPLSSVSPHQETVTRRSSNPQQGYVSVDTRDSAAFQPLNKKKHHASSPGSWIHSLIRCGGHCCQGDVVSSRRGDMCEGHNRPTTSSLCTGQHHHHFCSSHHFCNDDNHYRGSRYHNNATAAATTGTTTATPKKSHTQSSSSAAAAHILLYPWRLFRLVLCCFWWRNCQCSDLAATHPKFRNIKSSCCHDNNTTVTAVPADHPDTFLSSPSVHLSAPQFL